MFVVIEMVANNSNPEAYGRFVKLHGTYSEQDGSNDALRSTYDAACKLLHVKQPKMVHTLGVIGAASFLMAREEIRDEGEVMLFSEFSSPQRIWIFHSFEKDS